MDWSSLATFSWLPALLALLAARKTRLGQKLLEPSQIAANKAATENARLDGLEQATAMLETAMEKIRLLTGIVTTLQADVEKLKDFMRNVRRSAPQIGVQVSERGTLSVEPGAPILVVDDDQDVVDAVRLWLEDCNYSIVTATTVPDALQALASKQFAVVVVDLYLGTQTAATDRGGDRGGNNALADAGSGVHWGHRPEVARTYQDA